MPPGERREPRGCSFNSEKFLEGAAAVEAPIYFWRVTLKLTLGSASGPTEPTQSVRTSSQESWTRFVTQTEDHGTR